MRTRACARAALAGITGVALLGGATTAAQASPGRSEAGFWAHQKIEWVACQLDASDELGKQLDAAGARCADVAVPLDYARPGGPTITVAISRLPATDTRRRIGALLINGGGPGGIGLDMPLQVRPAMGKVGERYDLIGMDPRSVGRSAPVDCGWPTGSMHRSAGPDRASFERSVALSRSLAAMCGERAAGALPSISTRNTARDIDVVRAVLGERKLSYLGYSHGSYVGAVYAQLFPHRLDRFVLDGPMDPSKYGPQLLVDAGPANEKALADWAAWAAERDATYGLGRTQAEVLATVNDMLAAAANRPLQVGEFDVDSNLAPALLFSLLGSDLDEPRAEMAEVIRVLVSAAEHGSAEPSEALSEMLRFLLTGAESQYGSAQAAIICGDAGRRTGDSGVERAWQEIERSRAAMPFAGPVVRNLNACDFWPIAPREPLTRVDNEVPALIVAADGDPRTVYAHAQPLRRSLGAASRIVTLRNANHHATYARYGNACVDGAVNAYLDSGKLPSRDMECANEHK